MLARVIGIGSAAGDDGVGLAVVDALRAAPVPGGVELLQVAEPSELVDLLDDVPNVVLVDAVIGPGRAGDVIVLPASELEGSEEHPLSSHGVGVADAVLLAGAIHSETRARDVWIVGVRVRHDARKIVGLSPAVAEAVPRAASAVLERLRYVERP